MSESGELKIEVMLFIKNWVNEKKEMVPQKEIIIFMQAKGVESYRTLNIIKGLIDDSFIRKGYHPSQNRTFYVLQGNI